ncbi:Thermophilic serine proteinase precursor [Anaerohalosphaera lusitana]|uniref:Thermophilic serine proteinase n=1 Tax=Anaerohalosphaera lusitana TaxID=1936003 RepID=A0A1U9NLV4_9BACT|nr:S8 family serine peptidase [Anaerohalosphaera lusitana]AQT68718.1 Thermophilic serine proteinase precursor [Anaerohalosphaera lusitana]
MFKQFLIASLVLFAICAQTKAGKLTERGSAQYKDSYQPREILIKFKESALVEVKSAGKTERSARTLRPRVKEKLKGRGLQKGRGVFEHAFKQGSQQISKLNSRNGLEQKKKNLRRWYHYSTDENVDIQQLIEQLTKDESIEYVEPNYEWKMAWGFDPPIENLPDGTTDPMYPEQWYLTQAEIQATWNYINTNGICAGGNSDVTVAVIDSGVDYTHEELQASMWVNSAEIPGNGIDDDNNGFIDDIHGCNVVSDPRSHSGDPMDMHGHGTHVSGIISAQAFNGKGIIGTAFNTKIMAIRAAQYTGTLTIQDISEGIIYATENGAEVINMSFGGYQYSQIITDALEVALSQAVLVASSGNDSAPIPCYPAKYPYVIGVASCNTDGEKSWFSNPGDIMAPGESILSTLPNNSYAEWSGTSMAAPVVSGTAALLRSFFWQRDIYSNRFLMASIVSSGTVCDAYVAVTTPPTPGVTMYDNWIFDDPAISDENDADGSVDAGETIHMGIELINRSGAAENIDLTLRARAQGSMIDDPYVEIIDGTSSISAMGPWSMYDNGLIYDQDGVIIGVDDPLVFRVAPNCPNEHVIPFELTITFNDGWDPDNPESFTRISRWNYVVTRGKNVPRVIEQDMTLTSDEFWIVGGPVLIEEGVTLTIAEGSQIQFGSVSDDPYNPGPQNGYFVVEGKLEVQGTQDKPVNMFPSYLVAGQTTKITFNGGTANMKYTTVRNPEIHSGMGTLDHCYFEQDYGTPVIHAREAGYCIFHRLRPQGTLNIGYYKSCLFNSGWTWPHSNSLEFVDNVFLMDIENNKPVTFTPRATTIPEVLSSAYSFDYAYYDAASDLTYARLHASGVEFDMVERFAQFMGGHIASILSEDEQQLMETKLANNRYMRTHFGLTTRGFPREWVWLDGNELVYTYNGFGGTPGGAFPHMYFGDAYYDMNLGTRFDWKSFSGFSGWYRIGDNFVLKLPGEWTANELTTKLRSQEALDYVTQADTGHFRFNAFLNKYWDPSLNNWMHIQAPGNNENIVTMKDNFWGTDSSTLIDYLIYDYYDDFTKAKVVYGQPPARGYESTYPFVDGLYINGQSALSIPEVGMGPTTFRVTFNRDMNTDPNNIPFVTFGPTSPYTDFVVKPIDNDNAGWIDARTWEGSFWVVPVTGDGYHCIRISGAVAADDPWLVTGHDVGRFRFEVKTMGILAMTLHATGREGRIELSWQQDDFDMLAGYNIYRSTTLDGTYEKINDTIIPVGREYFTDTDVVPAVPLYYKFTVLKTDYTESNYSNVASAAPLDTIVPEITHTPVFEAVGGTNLRITASASDNVTVESVTLYYRAIGEEVFRSLSMLNTSEGMWSASISGSAVVPPGLDYYITATDGISTVYNGTPALPHTVNVENAPSLNSVSPNTGSADGGTLVTLSGSMFQTGATVMFGTEQAVDVEYLSSSQIRCKTPSHDPALVDVKLINPDMTSCSLTNAFTFHDEQIVISLPEAVGDYGTIVTVPLTLADVQGLLAASCTIEYDSSILNISSVNKGGLIPDWSFTANTATAGEIRISTAGAASVSDTGDLAVIKFEIIAPPPATSPLTIHSSVLNDGTISHAVDNGSVIVNGLFGISGTVSYFNDLAGIPSTALTLSGVGNPIDTVSEGTGSYSMQDIPVGSYRLKPAKSNDAQEITAFDASLILQADAGLRTLSQNQQIAADVNRNGLVSAMDASYILQKAVDLISVPFPGSEEIWTFVPEEREFPLLNTDQPGQNFTGILVGDVSGNWSDSMAQQTMSDLNSNTDPSTAVSLTDKTYLPHENCTLPIHITFEDGTEIYSVDLTVQYDHSIFGTPIVTQGEMVGLNNFSFISNTAVPGTIKLALAGAQPMQYDGKMADIQFASGPLNCTPVTVELNEAKVNEGAVDVKKTNADLATTPYHSDFTKDCRIDIADLLILGEAWLNYNTNPVVDVAPLPNGDQKIDLLDFTQLANDWAQ